MCRPQFKNLWFLWLRHMECACYFLQTELSKRETVMLKANHFACTTVPPSHVGLYKSRLGEPCYTLRNYF